MLKFIFRPRTNYFDIIACVTLYSILDKGQFFWLWYFLCAFICGIFSRMIEKSLGF